MPGFVERFFRNRQQQQQPARPSLLERFRNLINPQQQQPQQPQPQPQPQQPQPQNPLNAIQNIVQNRQPLFGLGGGVPQPPPAQVQQQQQLGLNLPQRASIAAGELGGLGVAGATGAINTARIAQRIINQLAEQGKEWLGTQEAMDLALAATGGLASTTAGALGGIGVAGATGAIKTARVAKMVRNTNIVRQLGVSSNLRDPNWASIVKEIEASRKAGSATGSSAKWALSRAKTIFKKGLTGLGVLTGFDWAIRKTRSLNRRDITKLQIGIAGTAIGVDVITTWYALDNVIGGQKFYVKDVLEGVQKQEINPIEALEMLSKSNEIRKIAMDKVELSAMLNPAMMPFKELLTAGMEGDEEAISLMEAAIRKAAEEFKANGGEWVDPEPVFEEEYLEAINKRREMELAFREEDRIYFEQMEKARRAMELQERAEDTVFWDQVRAELRELELKWQKEDAEYFRQVREENRKRREGEARSTLGFGLL